MKTQPMKSFQGIDQALQAAEVRLGLRTETARLAAELSAARLNLRAIEEAFSEAQEERAAATAGILLCEGQLREALTATERAIREALGPTTPTLYFMSAAPELLRIPSGRARLERVKAFLSLLESAPRSLGVSSQAAAVRPRLFALEDALHRFDALLLAEARTQSERRMALEKAQQLLQRLHFLFPEEPRHPDGKLPFSRAA